MSEWKRRIVDGGYNADWKCKNCGHVVITDFPPRYCPKCESDNRPRENNSSSMIINGKYSENVEYGTRVEIQKKKVKQNENYN